MRPVLANGVGIKKGEFVPNGVMTEKLDATVKKQLLKYMTANAPDIVGDTVLRDPVTGNAHSLSNSIWENDGFRWSTQTIYMLKTYDIRLSEEFKQYALSK